jgi:hypothetical protein
VLNVLTNDHRGLILLDLAVATPVSPRPPAAAPSSLTEVPRA